jgi:hypothetical protein
MIDTFILAESFKYIGYGILISGLFIFIAFSLFVYLNGREIQEYYLILFGKLSKKDIIFFFILTSVFTFYYYASNIDNIYINSRINMLKYEGKEDKTSNSIDFNLNLYIKKEDSIDYKEESVKRYPNSDYYNISK